MLDTERSTRLVRVEERCLTFMLDSKLWAVLLTRSQCVSQLRSLLSALATSSWRSGAMYAPWLFLIVYVDTGSPIMLWQRIRLSFAMLCLWSQSLARWVCRTLAAHLPD